MRNIVLTGFMGTGKTSSGLLLAKKCGLAFVDTDDLVETLAGQSVKEIFEKKGEKYFRRLEKKIIAHVSGLSGLVVAAGGGVVVDPSNMKRLRKTGTVVALVSKAEVIIKRVLKEGDKRPLLNQKTAKEKLKKVKVLLSKRLPLYTVSADYVLDTSCLTPESTAGKVLCLIKSKSGK